MRPEKSKIIGPNGAGKTSILNCISGFTGHNKGASCKARQQPGRRPKPPLTRSPGWPGPRSRTSPSTPASARFDNLMAARHPHEAERPPRCLYWGWPSREEVATARWRDHRLPGDAQIRKAVVGALPCEFAQARRAGPRFGEMEPSCCCWTKPMAGMNLEEKEDMACSFSTSTSAAASPSCHRARHGTGHGHLRPRGGAPASRKIADGPPDIRSATRRHSAYLGEA